MIVLYLGRADDQPVNPDDEATLVQLLQAVGFVELQANGVVVWVFDRFCTFKVNDAGRISTLILCNFRHGHQRPWDLSSLNLATASIV